MRLPPEEEVNFATFDILTDQDVRAGPKTFSNWPTYPQLYVRGKLLGGLDILNELAEDGDLKEELNEGVSLYSFVRHVLQCYIGCL